MIPMTSLLRRLPFLANHFIAACRTGGPAMMAAPGAPVLSDRALESRRGEAMRRLFPKLYAWSATRGKWGLALNVHAYLAEATTLEQLEERIAAVEQMRDLRA